MKHIQKAQMVPLRHAEVYNDVRRTSLSEKKLITLHAALMRPGFHVLHDISREEICLSIQTLAALISPWHGLIIADYEEAICWCNLNQSVFDTVLATNFNTLALYDFIIISGTPAFLASNSFESWEEYIAVTEPSKDMPIIMIV